MPDYTTKTMNTHTSSIDLNAPFATEFPEPCWKCLPENPRDQTNRPFAATDRLNAWVQCPICGQKGPEVMVKQLAGWREAAEAMHEATAKWDEGMGAMRDCLEGADPIKAFGLEAIDFGEEVTDGR